MIKNRQEILFIYDVTDANPNGDPLDGNKPRIDEETSINIVTDVRLKRTIRDYLCDYLGYDGTNKKDIFVRELRGESSGLQDAKKRALDFLDSSIEDSEECKKIIDNVINKIKIKKDSFFAVKKNVNNSILDECIDVRLFGATIPFELKKEVFEDSKKEIKDSITFTGPVQFNMGRSLNKVNIMHIKGTGAFASKEGKDNKTFREEYVVPYSLIAFHGIVNENAAKNTKLADEDVSLMEEAMWNGTKNLITRSKMGHMPRLLVRVKYKEESNFFIGDLQKKVKMYFKKNEEKIRGLEDFSLEIKELISELAQNKNKIHKIKYICDKNLNLTMDGKEISFESVGLPFEQKLL